MGLGSARSVPLAIAREKAAAARLLLTDRIDPLAHRQHDMPSPNFQKIEHHSALPYEEIATFVAELQKRGGIAARALEFTILSVALTSEVIGAARSEFDLATDQLRVG